MSAPIVRNWHSILFFEKFLTKFARYSIIAYLCARILTEISMNRLIKYTAFATLLVLFTSCKESVTPTLNVEGGDIVGIELENSVVYRGIPYAAPPVGDLRWAKPQPVADWQGTRKCDGFGNAAIQAKHDPNDGVYGTEFYAEDAPMSEDCLYLNVWTPKMASAHPEKKLPVAVWIHGGAFMAGWGHEIEFDGDAWAKRNVILVTINYRLGLYGFFCHPLLSTEDENGISGNYGLYDQAKAIEWVYNNISEFGGDPDNITIFGQSAGAMSVKYQVASPVSQQFISKAIIMSGGGIGGVSLNQTGNQEQLDAPGLDMMNMAGLYTLESMRAATPEQLDSIVQNYQKIMHRQLPMRPHNDEVFAPLTFDEAVAQSAIADIPYMIGGTADDLANLDKGCDKFAFLRDSLSEQPTFVYLFDAPAPSDGRPCLEGSFHSSELWYVFNTLSRSWRPYADADHALSEKMVDYWTNFAKFGNPNGNISSTSANDSLIWKPCTIEEPYIQKLCR